MENILKLGGKEFKVEINFKKSYELTKYRNKISMGFDFSNTDKKVVEEVLSATQKQMEGKNIDLSKLSEEALKFLMEQSKNTILTYEEIIDIVKILTGIESQEEIEQLLNQEMEETDYDSVIGKIIGEVNMVFMNVKGTSK